MQPWGVAGGGPKNEQSINDLVAYIQSIQKTPAQAKKAGDGPARRPRRAWPARSTTTRSRSPRRTSSARRPRSTPRRKRPPTRLAAGGEGARHELVDDHGRDAKRSATPILAELETDPANIDKRRRQRPCKDFVDAVDERSSTAQAKLDWAETWGDLRDERHRRSDALRAELRPLPHRGLVGVRSDGAADARRVNVLGLPGGGGGKGGGIGFNLRDGSEIRRFGTRRGTVASRRRWTS